MHRFTPKEIRFLEQKIAGRPFVELTELFNRHFNLSLTFRQITGACNYHRLRNGRGTGHVSPNKGRKGWHPPGAVLFKPGHKGYGRLPLGTERINEKGYIKVKISHSKTQRKSWKSKHVILWEKAHGKVPKGCAIIFADKNKLNLDLANLLLVSKREFGVMNRFRLISNNADVTKVGKTIADIHILIAKRKRSVKK
jgi:hypothetical protein